jgi:hypothetical protein
MRSTALIFLIVAMVATMCQAFAPAIPSLSSTTCLNLFGNIQNAYLRGGKPSWEFETETMYIDDPKAKGKKPVVGKAKATATTKGKTTTMPKTKAVSKVSAKTGRKIYSF